MMKDSLMRNNAVSVVGLGKLGLCLAACFADSGIRTVGVDIDRATVNTVNAGKSPIVEPELDQTIARTAGKTLFASTNAARAVSEADITYVLVNTPSNENGAFTNDQVESALTNLATELAISKKKNHLFVISSTVMPGSIEDSFVPLLERASGRKANQGFMVAYCPDFVALGSVMKDFFHPDFVLIGESCAEAGEMVKSLHLAMCRNQPPVRRMPLLCAELAKVSLNAYITLKISFANTVANYCEQIPGADPDLITSAIGLDRRISPHYLKGGLAYGGTCFPRDTKAFKAVAKRLGQPSTLMEASEAVNRRQDDLLVRHTAAAMAKSGGKLGILGLSFKPNTPVIVESPGVKLMEEMLARGIETTVYDPLAMPEVTRKFAESPGLGFATSAKECLEKADVAVLAVQSGEYREAVYSLASDKIITIIDCWRQLHSTRIPAGVSLKAMGKYFE